MELDSLPATTALVMILKIEILKTRPNIHLWTKHHSGKGMDKCYKQVELRIHEPDYHLMNEA